MIRRLRIKGDRPSQQELEPLRQVVATIANMPTVVDLKVDIPAQCYPDIWESVSKFQKLQSLVLEGSFNSMTVNTLLLANPAISHMDFVNFREKLFKIRDAFQWTPTSPTLQVLNIDCLTTHKICGAILDEDGRRSSSIHAQREESHDQLHLCLRPTTGTSSIQEALLHYVARATQCWTCLSIPSPVSHVARDHGRNSLSYFRNH